MSFVSGFLGGAASATDDSLRKWKQLFQADEELEFRRAAERDRMTLDKQRVGLEGRRLDISESQFNRQQDWQEQFQTLELDFRNDEFSYQKFNDFVTNVQGSWPELTTGERIAFLDQFDHMPFSSTEQGQAYSGLFRAKTRADMSPTQAKITLGNILNQPFGTRTAPWLVDMALDALEGEEGYDAIKDEMDLYLQGDVERWEEGRNLGLAQDYAALEQTKATTRNTDAQSGVYTAQTETLFQGLEFDRDLHPLAIQAAQASLDAASVQLDMEKIRLGELPEQLRNQNLQLVMELTRGNLSNEILERTMDAQIETIIANGRQAAAEAGMSEEDLRFAYATATTREAILLSQQGHTEASTRVLLAQEGLTRAQELDTNAMTDSRRWQIQESRIATVTELVANGEMEVFGSVGIELLTPLVGDRAEETFNTLQSRTVNLREAFDRRLLAGVIIEEAKADQEAWMADNQALVYEETNRQNWYQLGSGRMGAQASVTSAGASVTNAEASMINANASMMSARTNAMVANHQIAHANRQWDHKLLNPEQRATFNEALNSARLAGGRSIADVSDMYREGQVLVSRVASLRTLAEEGRMTELAAEAERYGYDPETLEVTLAALEEEADQMQAQASRDAAALSSLVAREGYILEPTNFGLDPLNENDFAFWSRVDMRNPVTYTATINRTSAENAVLPDVDALVNRTVSQLADTMGLAPDAVLEFMYDELFETHGADLALAGIESLTDLEPLLRDQYTLDYAPVMEGVHAANTFLTPLIGAVDLKDIAATTAARSFLDEQLSDTHAMQRRVESFASRGALHRSPGTSPAILDQHSALAVEVQRTLGLPYEQLVEMGAFEYVQHVLAPRGGTLVDMGIVRQLLAARATTLDEHAEAFSEFNSRYAGQ